MLGGAPIDAERAYQAIRNGLELMTNNIDEGLRGGWKDDLLRAGASSGDDALLDVSPKRWRTFARVPGQEEASSKSLSGALNKAFDLLYGKPSARRGGVIYEHYYTWKKNLLEDAWSGKMIDEDLLVNQGFAKNTLEANELLSRGERSTVVRNLKRSGYRLQTDIDAAAAAYAKSTADSMMYQMSTVSVAGKKMSRLYPWGRAQTDYLGYWAKKLTEPTTLKVPFSPATKFTRKTVGSSIPGLPTNVRLMDRIGHVANLGADRTTETVGDSRDEAARIYSPEWFVQGFSFMPTKLDDAFLVENSLSPGPIASWLVNFMPKEALPRRMFEEAHPQHRTFNDYENNGFGESLLNLADAIVPESPRSLRRLFGTELSNAFAQFGIDPAGIYRFFTGESEPPFYRSQLGLTLGNWLNEGDFWNDVVAGTGQGTPWGDETYAIGERAMKNAYGRDAMELMRKQVGLPAVFRDEVQYAKFYIGLEDQMDRWVNLGYISPGLAENYRASLKEVAEGLRDEAGVGDYPTIAGRRAFIDAARDIYYALPDPERLAYQIMNPGVTVNHVGWVEVEGRVPDEWAASVSGGRIVVDGAKATEAYAAGREEGWLVPRAQEDIMADVGNSLNRAASSYLSWVFEWSTGSNYSRQTRRTDDDGKVKTTKFGRGVVSLTPEHVAYIKPILDELGVDIPLEWATDAGWSMPIDEWKQALSTVKSQHQPTFEIDKNTRNGVNKGDNGPALLAAVDNATKFTNDVGLQYPTEWPKLEDTEGIEWITGSAAGDLEAYRAEFRGQIATNPHFTEAMYNETFRRYFGALDYAPPVPPAVTELETRVSGAPAEFRVVDGDTLAYMTPDGEETRFRLLGINAPDDHETQTGYVEATDSLRAFLNEHDNVTLGTFETERYGTTQKFKSFVGDGRVVQDERIFAWLYVDGVAVWNPAEFTADNPRGLPTNAIVPQYQTYFDREAAGDTDVEVS